VAARVVPGAALRTVAAFPGGLSAEMTLLEAQATDGAVHRLVVREPRHEGRSGSSLPLVTEVRLLDGLHRRGMAVPRPRLYDDSGTVLDHPYCVFDHIDGAPRSSSADPAATGRAFAAELAAVHRVEGTDPLCRPLPERSARVAQELERPRDRPDESPGEGHLRRVLAQRWPPPVTASPVLLHGDFWAGNLLWRGDRVVGVIDWEKAARGDRLADVATTRLDLLWAFGPLAMTAFTDHYVSLTASSDEALALWDVAAAVRPCGYLSAWAADWSDFGRPDVDVASLRAAHRWFADQALARLGEPGITLGGRNDSAPGP